MADAPKISSADVDAARDALRVGAGLAGLDLVGLWLAQVPAGGYLSPGEVMTALATCRDARRHNTLIDAVNDELIDAGLGYRVPYLDGTHLTS